MPAYRCAVVAVVVSLLAGCAPGWMPRDPRPSPVAQQPPQPQIFGPQWFALARTDPTAARAAAYAKLQRIANYLYGHGDILEGDDVTHAAETRRIDTLPLEAIPGYVTGVLQTAGERPGSTQALQQHVFTHTLCRAYDDEHMSCDTD